MQVWIVFRKMKVLKVMDVNLSCISNNHNSIMINQKPNNKLHIITIIIKYGNGSILQQYIKAQNVAAITTISEEIKK